MDQLSLGHEFRVTEDIGDELDFWETPPAAVDAVLPLLPPRARECVMLEPCAGRGAIVERWMRYSGSGPERVSVFELSAARYDECVRQLDPARIGRWYQEDFLALDVESIRATFQPGPVLVLTNPPYSRALDFVKRSLDVAAPDGIVAMLLQNDFATGVDRCRVVHDRHPSSFHPLRRRPSFGRGGTGKRPYAWFIWDLACPRWDWRPIG